MNRSEHYEKAFMELYNQHVDDVFRFCYVRLRDRDQALDITQDTFYKLWNEFAHNPKKIDQLDNLRAFLFRIARNTLIDSTRKKKSTPFSFLTTTFDGESSAIEPISFADTTLNPEQRHQFSTLAEHLELLDEHHREIIVLRFVHDMSVIDIADLYSISENTASVRIHRALEHARKKLAHLYE
jgi:RNA polymerase sigma-70 factor (ECF subfamily)